MMSQVISTWLQCVFPHQIWDVLLKLGHVEQHLAVSPHFQTQVVARGVNFMGLEATKQEGNESYEAGPKTDNPSFFSPK